MAGGRPQDRLAAIAGLRQVAPECPESGGSSGQFDSAGPWAGKPAGAGAYYGCSASKAPPMATIAVKIALLAGLGVLTLGVIPDRRRGGIIAIATCVAAAFVLHFVAP